MDGHQTRGRFIPAQLDPTTGDAERAILDRVGRQLVQCEHGRHAAVAIDLLRNPDEADIVILEEWAKRFFRQLWQRARYRAFTSEKAGSSIERGQALGKGVLRQFGIGMAVTQRGQRIDHRQQVLEPVAQFLIEQGFARRSCLELGQHAPEPFADRDEAAARKYEEAENGHAFRRRGERLQVLHQQYSGDHGAQDRRQDRITPAEEQRREHDRWVEGNEGSAVATCVEHQPQDGGNDDCG